MPIKKKLSGINLLTVLFLFLLTAISSYAQDNPSEEKYMLDRMKSEVKTKMTISGIKTEAKGDHETYIIAHQGNYLFVYNKNKSFINSLNNYCCFLCFGCRKEELKNAAKANSS